MSESSTKPTHFRTSPCEVGSKGGDWGQQSSDADEVTCSECMPIAAKHRRGAALQDYEVAETKFRAAHAVREKARDAVDEAERAANAAWQSMDEKRAALAALLGLLGGAS